MPGVGAGIGAWHRQGGGARPPDLLNQALPSDAYNFVAASTQVVTLSASANSVVAPRSVKSITVRFRSSDVGTTRRTFYSEGSGSANDTLLLGLNNGAAGRVEAIQKDTAANLVNITFDGGYNDGNWHVATFVSRAANDHELMIDGVSRGTSSVTLGAQVATAQKIGVRMLVGSQSASTYMQGDISYVLIHGVALSLAEHTSLYNRSVKPLNVRPKADLRSYIPLVGTAIVDWGDPNRAIATLSASAPSLVTSTGLLSVAAIGNTSPIISPMAATALITRGALDADGDRLLREPSNIVYDPNDAAMPYKMYYAGSPNPYNQVCGTYMAYALSRLGPWTKYGAVIPVGTIPLEDTYVVLDGGFYHLWAENKTGGTNTNGIAYFKSTDGVSWTRQDSNGSPAFTHGAVGTWDVFDVASPIVWKEGATWYMLYEGREQATPAVGGVGLATATSPAGPWTRSPSNPVMVGASGQWDDHELVPDDIRKIRGTYYFLYHAHEVSNTYWGCGYATSLNLTTWARPTFNQFVGRNRAYTQMYVSDDLLIALNDIDGGGDGAFHYNHLAA